MENALLWAYDRLKEYAQGKSYDIVFVVIERKNQLE